MKRFALIITLAVCAPLARGQDADEIVSRVRAAMGSEARAAEDGAVRIHGALYYQGTDARYELIFDESGRFLDHIEGPLSELRGYDGETLWERDWNDSPRVLEYGEREGALVQASLWTGRWTEPDLDLAFERVDGEPATLAFRSASGLTKGRIELDPATWLPRRATWNRAGAVHELTFEDWTLREGLRLPSVLLHSDGPTINELRVEGVERLASLPDVSPRLERPADTRFEAARDPALEVKRTRTGHLIVKPRINGEDLGWFIFDTGAGANVISTHVAELLDAELFGKTTARGIGGEVSASFLRARELVIGPVTIAAPLFVTMDLQFLTAPLGEEIGGVLGYGVLARSVTEYDFANARIRLFDPASYELRGSSWDDVHLLYRHPHVRAKLEGHDGLLLLDTGNAGSALLVYRQTVERLGLLEDRDTRAGTSGGVGGTVPVRVGTIESIEFGGRRFESVEASFATGRGGAMDNPFVDGNVGSELLKTMTLVLDYSNRRIAFIDAASER